jgi:hypothetical protein
VLVDLAGRMRSKMPVSSIFLRFSGLEASVVRPRAC